MCISFGPSDNPSEASGYNPALDCDAAAGGGGVPEGAFVNPDNTDQYFVNPDNTDQTFTNPD